VSNADTVRRAFAAVEANDVHTYVSLFTDDAVYQAANFPPVTGPEGIRQFAAPVMETFSRVTHDIKAMWEPERDVVIAEVVLTYHRKDGKVVKLPCLDVIRLDGGKIQSLQAYLDITPAFA
jgi:ketosteroid isomerase-like protein